MALARAAERSAAALDDLDDFGSAWQDALESGARWGGRGKGGRGMGRHTESTATRDVHVDGVTLQFAGRELLKRTVLRLGAGRRYALLGRNGVGKSTLLRRIASGKLPGFPRHLRVSYVAQEEDAPDPSATVLDSLMSSTTDDAKAALEAEREALEKRLDTMEGGGGGAMSKEEELAFELKGVTGRLNEIDGKDLPEAEAANDETRIQRLRNERAALSSRKEDIESGKALEEEDDDDEYEFSDQEEGKEEEEDEEIDGDELQAIAERLGELEDEISSIDSGKARAAAAATLRGLGFSDERMETLAGDLSGGWRMRLTIARSLLACPDILLLDEPTNHLDLHGVLWLQSFLTSEGRLGGYSDGNGGGGDRGDRGSEQPPTLVLVSHDEEFVRGVATDVIVFDGDSKALSYFPGTYDEWKEVQLQRAQANNSRLDARHRQEAAARKSAAAMRKKAAAAGKKKGKKGKVNDNALRQAKQKEKKIARIGLFRDDGKAFKLQSLAKFDAKAVLLPQRAEAAKLSKSERFSFPAFEDGAGLELGGSGAIITMEGVSFSYPGRGGGRGSSTSLQVLRDVSFSVSLRSRVAIVGENGAGKTTLAKLILKELSPTRGEVRRSPRLRAAHVPQHHTEETLRGSLHKSASEFLSDKFSCSRLDARSRLGKFGLGGNFAVMPMERLSGGQKVRVSLAAITWQAPHLLVMDEPTNHLDGEALDALADALKEFAGAVLLISHNRAFCAAFCRELWVVESGTVKVRSAGAGGDDDDGSGSGSEAFGALFSQYSADVARRIRRAGGTGGVSVDAGGGGGGRGGGARQRRAVAAAASRRGKRGGAEKGSVKRTTMM